MILPHSLRGAFLIVALAALSGCSRPEPRQPVQTDEGLEVIEQVDSEYTRISVRKVGTLRGLFFMRSGKPTLQSAIDLADPGSLPIAYERFMTLGMAYLDRVPARAAMIGLGSGRSASYHHSVIPAMQIDVAEIDPEVLRLARTHFRFIENDRLKVHIEDGRVFLQRSADSAYDLILLDAYSHSFAPFHLTTREFLQTAKAKLAPGGVVLQNISPNVMLFGSTYHTLKAVFDNVDAFEADGNVILVAYDGAPISDDALVARSRQRQVALKPRYELPALVMRRGSVNEAIEGRILTDDFSPSEILSEQPMVAGDMVRSPVVATNH